MSTRARTARRSARFASSRNAARLRRRRARRHRLSAGPRRLRTAQPAAQPRQPARAERRVPSAISTICWRARRGCRRSRCLLPLRGGREAAASGVAPSGALEQARFRRDPSPPTPLPQGERGDEARLAQLREAFPGRLWIGACPTYGADMRGGLAERAALARKLGAPLSRSTTSSCTIPSGGRSPTSSPASARRRRSRRPGC